MEVIPVRRLVMIVLLLSPLWAPSSEASEAPLDVAGVKVGMPVSAAIDVIKAHNPQMQTRLTSHKIEHPGLPSFVDQLSANANQVKGTEDITVDEIVVDAAPGEPNVVVGIWRQFNYRKGRERVLAEVLDGLKEKYGEPRLNAPGGNNDLTLSWYFDAAGKPLGAAGVTGGAAIAASSLCNFVAYQASAPNFKGNDLIDFPPKMDSVAGTSVLHVSSYVCARVARSYSNNDLVTEVKVYAFDQALMAARYKAAASIAAEFARQQKEKETDAAAKRGVGF
jgi:hypothetical protein